MVRTLNCDFCMGETPVATVEQRGDASLCPKCAGEWDREVAACDHDWQMMDGEDGICRKCQAMR